MPLSVSEQDRRIRAIYPRFQLVLDCGFMGVWEGPLTPIFKTYTIRITYLAYNVFDNFILANPIESVVVLDPPIGRDPRGTGERAQHVYWWDRHPDFPRLCLHDPLAADWDWNMPIVETLIPFTIDWLLWHEDWVATGQWRGRGRHPEPPRESQWQSTPLSPADPAPRARSLNAGFHALGRKIGVFGSYPSMGVASVAYFQPQFWQASNSALPEDARLATTSIWSPVLPLAA